MSDTPDFLEPGDKELEDQFLTNGFVIRPVEDIKALEVIRKGVAQAAGTCLGVGPVELNEFLNGVHEKVSSNDLNDFRFLFYL